MAVFWKRCTVCGMEVEVDTPSAPVPDHGRLDEPDIACPGSGEDGELVREEERSG